MCRLLEILCQLSLAELRLVLLFSEWLGSDNVELSGRQEWQP